MPFCTQCGQPVSATARFCASCGAPQPVLDPGTARQAESRSWLDGISARVASILCYLPVVGVVACGVVLAAERFRHELEARFHASQGLYLFVGWLVLDWGLKPFFLMLPFGDLHFLVLRALKALLWVTCLFMIIKAAQGEAYRLPVLGELADRSLSEQR